MTKIRGAGGWVKPLGGGDVEMGQVSGGGLGVMVSKGRRIVCMKGGGELSGGRIQIIGRRDGIIN